MALGSVMTPWYRRLSTGVGRGPEEPGATSSTAILDYDAPEMTRMIDRARDDARSSDPVSVLGAAHAIIRQEVRAVYSVEERTPASQTLLRGFGSCSQRLAILESVARAIGVPTRVRALSIDRAFWYPRFPHLTAVLPDRILLAWPEFRIDEWHAASELFGPIGCRGGGAFTNRGAETLFEAVGRCAIDWDGRAGDASYDLSQFVRAHYGYFRHRDDVFALLGQTLCAPSRKVADPLLRRIAA